MSEVEPPGGERNPMREVDPYKRGPGKGNTRPELQCTAHTSSGAKCKMARVPGATVCRYHGGAAPQVQRKARLRLAELIDPAIATLAREMANADRSSDKQRAANSILDRAGVPRTSAQVDQDTARQMLIERIHELRDQQVQEGDPGAPGSSDDQDR